VLGKFPAMVLFLGTILVWLWLLYVVGITSPLGDGSLVGDVGDGSVVSSGSRPPKCRRTLFLSLA
jgi:hypothetical protein